MAQQTIGIGASANDGTGDPLRTAFGKANSNFTELYAGGHALPAGTVSSPAVKIGAANTGLYWDAVASRLAFTIGGVETVTISAGTLSRSSESESATISVTSGVGSSIIATRASSNTTPPQITLRKAGGTPSALAIVPTNAELGRVDFGAYDGSSYRVGMARISAVLVEPTPSTTALGTELRFLASALGAASGLEVARMSRSTGLSLMGANVVIDENRNHQLRSYTVATVPVATAAAKLIYVSNETGGAVPAFSDGTNWRRVTDRAVIA